MLWKYVHMGIVYENQVMDWCKGQEKKTQGALQHSLKKLVGGKISNFGQCVNDENTDWTCYQSGSLWNAVEAELSIFPFPKSLSSSIL